jgi:hypothetical protein
MYQGLVDQGAINAKVWNGGMGAAQMTWLDGVLEQADAENEQVVLFSHFPVYPKDPHNLWNHEALRAVLRAHPSVVAYINGHNHAGNYGMEDGIHYLTLHAIVETPNTSAFGVVEVYEDHLAMTGFGREPNRKLERRR